MRGEVVHFIAGKLESGALIGEFPCFLAVVCTRVVLDPGRFCVFLFSHVHEHERDKQVQLLAIWFFCGCIPNETVFSPLLKPNKNRPLVKLQMQPALVVSCDWETACFSHLFGLQKQNDKHKRTGVQVRDGP